MPGAPAAAGARTAEDESDLQIVDPLADALAAIKAGATKPGRARRRRADTKSVDPLADVMADIKAQRRRAHRCGRSARADACRSAATNGAATC